MRTILGQLPRVSVDTHAVESFLKYIGGVKLRYLYLTQCTLKNFNQGEVNEKSFIIQNIVRCNSYGN